MVIKSGLATWIVSSLPVGDLGPLGVALLMAYATMLLSNLMSNTAAANILVPIGISLAAAGGEALIALSIALAASTAMCLPIATPPNALVFSTGRLSSREFLKLGIPMGLLAPAAMVAWVWWIVDFVVAG